MGYPLLRPPLNPRAKDPVGLAAGTNVYEYCGGEPVNRLDLGGLWTVSLGVMGVLSTPTAWGGGGGTMFNLGYDRSAGLSFSITGTAVAGVSPGFGVGLSGVFQWTNAGDVNRLLGEFNEAGVGATPGFPVTLGYVGTADGGVSGFSISKSLPGIAPPLVTSVGGRSTTSAILQITPCRGFGVGVTPDGALLGR